jgi:hypothetical protein
MAFTVDIRGNASHLQKTLNSAKGAISSLGNVAQAGVASLAALGAAGAAGIAAFVVSSSKAASNIESLTMQFKTLLGGSDAAGKRMEEIVKFAASTPFEIPELAATSKLLQTMGGNILATGEGLRMVGDAAAISGRPLEEVGTSIGRVFNALTSGTSAGEAVNRMQELGLITGDVKREFEALAAAQSKGKAATLTSEQALAKLKSVLAKTDGAMIALSATTEGMKSNLADNIGQLQAAFGEGFNKGFRDLLTQANNFLPELKGKFSDAGNFIGAAISDSITGDTERFKLLGQAVGDVFVAGMKAAVLTGLDNLGESMGGGIATQVQSAPNFGALGLLPQGLRDKLAGGIRETFRGQTNFVDEFGRQMQDTGASASVDALKQNSEALKQKIADDAKYTQELLQGNEEMVNLLKIISGKNPMSITSAKFTN